MTTIDLGECEYLLRKEYNISDEKKLYMNGNNLVKLNLIVCENSKITLSVPVSISESLEKLNSSSDYNNDICFQQYHIVVQTYL